MFRISVILRYFWQFERNPLSIEFLKFLLFFWVLSRKRSCPLKSCWKWSLAWVMVWEWSVAELENLKSLSISSYTLQLRFERMIRWENIYFLFVFAVYLETVPIWKIIVDFVRFQRIGLGVTNPRVYNSDNTTND